MNERKKRPFSLQMRIAGNLLLLAAMAVLAVGMVRFPGWRLERELRAAMEADDGGTGPGELLWRGEVYDGTGWWDTSILRNGEKLYAAWLSSFDGHIFPHVDRGTLPGSPAVFPCNGNISWTAAQTRQGEWVYQLLAANLPEKAAGGRLTVTLLPGAAVRTVEGEREGQVIPFRPGGDWLEIDMRHDTDWNRNRFPTSLEGLPYTLTLWDGSGAVLSETAGTLSDIWGR